ncbi:MAG TPA: hypothetical protein VHK67_06385 [Rhabdochlamydiaceae bacterium]|jgi:hypothetical protein|nr:hypothetical protein [Rhabdochlamydiaceae bacterium]
MFKAETKKLKRLLKQRTPKFLRRFWIIVALIPFFFFWTSTKKFDGWTHLELGAGNYGADGHTQCSQKKTVLMRIKHVSALKNYIDELNEKGSGAYKPEDQYRILFATLDELVARYGPVGVFHVNDLYEDYASFATNKLKTYAKQKGYASIIINSIPGDYQHIDAKKSLSKYGRKKYDTVHLKNPEVSLYHDVMDGDDFRASPLARQETRQMLKKLATLSNNGLHLFILYHKNFIPNEEQEEFVDKGIFYKTTQEWKPVPYIFPEGDDIPEKYGRVFLIEP